MNDEDRKNAGWKFESELRKDGLCYSPQAPDEGLPPTSKVNDTGSTNEMETKSQVQTNPEIPPTRQDLNKPPETHEYPLPSLTNESTSKSPPPSLVPKPGHNWPKKSHQGNASDSSPLATAPNNSQLALEADQQIPRTVDVSLNMSNFKGLIPHLPAGRIECGLETYEKPLSKALNQGAAKMSNARNHADFLQETRALIGQNSTQKQYAQCARYRQVDDPEVTANSEGRDNCDNEYCW